MYVGQIGVSGITNAMPQFFSDAIDDALAYERCETFGGGMDGFTRSTLLPMDAFQYGLNTHVPDGMEVGTRPGADMFGDAVGGKIQGLLYFDTSAAIKQIIAGSDNKLWYQTISGAVTGPWTEMTGFTLTNSTLAFSAAQGVDTALFTDGTKEMQSWNGTVWSGPLGVTDFDPPQTATILLWHAGRMWATGFPGGTVGKEDDAIWGSNLLSFGSGAWDRTDRNIRIGGGEGDPIVGIASLSNSAQLGFVMAVLKRNSIWLINTDPTASFTNFSANIGPQRIGGGVGCVGKRAFCVSGNDLIYVSPDKTIRSLARMEGAESQYIMSPPMSLPIQNYMKRINWNVSHLIACAKYGEMIFVSVPLDASLTPNTVFAYNARLQKWVGIWTGWTANSFAVTFFNGVQALMMGDNTGKVNKWKDGDDDTADETYLDNGVAIPTAAWLRSWFFGEPLNDKDPRYVETRFGQSNGLVNVTLNGDGVDLYTWTKDARADGPVLEIDLEFDLVSDGNRPFRESMLDHATPANEYFIKLESTAGWWRLRNATMAAYVNTLEME